MLAPETKKLLALTLALTVLLGGTFTQSTFQDSEGTAVTLDVGNTAGIAGDQQTNDVAVGVGNTESCSGEECTSAFSPVIVDIPDVGEVRYSNGGM